MGLLYGARMARCDLLHSISVLSSRFVNWTIQCDEMCHQLYSYVAATVDLVQKGRIGIGTSDSLRVVAYPDADLGGDAFSSRSTTGGCLCVEDQQGGAMLISAWSKRQPSSATSTAESEMTSMAYCTKMHVVPTQSFLDEVLMRTVYALVLEDNTSVIAILACGYSLALRCLAKHTRLNIGALSELYSDPTVRAVRHVVSRQQRGDLMTKGLPGPTHGRALQLMGLLPKSSRFFEFDAVEGIA